MYQGRFYTIKAVNTQLNNLEQFHYAAIPIFLAIITFPFSSKNRRQYPSLPVYEIRYLIFTRSLLTVHVKVEVVKLYSIGIGFGSVHRRPHPVHFRILKKKNSINNRQSITLSKQKEHGSLPQYRYQPYKKKY